MRAAFVLLRVRRGLPSRVGRRAGGASSSARLGPSTARRRGRSQSTVRRESRWSVSLSGWRIGWRGQQAYSRALRAARAAEASWGGVEAKCLVGGFRLGRTPSRTSPCGIGLQISLGDDPRADQAESLPEASGELGVRVPARLKHAQDVSAAEPVDLDIHDATAVILAGRSAIGGCTWASSSSERAGRGRYGQHRPEWGPVR